MRAIAFRIQESLIMMAGWLRKSRCAPSLQVKRGCTIAFRIVTHGLITLKSLSTCGTPAHWHRLRVDSDRFFKLPGPARAGGSPSPGPQAARDTLRKSFQDAGGLIRSPPSGWRASLRLTGRPSRLSHDLSRRSTRDSESLKIFLRSRSGPLLTSDKRYRNRSWLGC